LKLLPHRPDEERRSHTFRSRIHNRLQEYMDRRHSILIELLRHEALPTASTCSHYNQASAIHRCRDCFGPNFWCVPCCISAHRTLPFHRVEIWNGNFFDKLDLLTHGLAIDLCHYPDNCPSMQHNTETNPSTLDLSDGSDEFMHGNQPSADSESTTNGYRSNITIVSSTGIFTRSIRWCSCAKSTRQYAQLLLRAKLFPASFINLHTTFTFEVLDHFQIDSLECKTAAMNFMSKIGRITNEAFPSKVPVGIPIDRNQFPH
jgi:CxC2 like cysteine cluster associated with KDZ transposases